MEPTSTPIVGSSRIEQLDLRLHPAGDDDLLLIAAAESVAIGLLGIAAALTEKRLSAASCRRTSLRRADELRTPLPVATGLMIDVLAHREVGGEALLARAGSTRSRCRLRMASRRIGRIETLGRRAGRRPAVERELAEDGPPDRVMTGAAQADEAQRFARADREGDRPDAAPRPRPSTESTTRSEAAPA